MERGVEPGSRDAACGAVLFDTSPVSGIITAVQSSNRRRRTQGPAQQRLTENETSPDYFPLRRPPWFLPSNAARRNVTSLSYCP